MAEHPSQNFGVIQLVAGGIASGFLAEIGKLILEATAGQRFVDLRHVIAEDIQSAIIAAALIALLQIAFWLATFGAIAAVALGVAGISEKRVVQKWCYGISSASHLLGNCYVFVIAAGALSSMAKQ